MLVLFYRWGAVLEEGLVILGFGFFVCNMGVMVFFFRRCYGCEK